MGVQENKLGHNNKGLTNSKNNKEKDVWTTLLQISGRHAPAEGRLHHRPHRAHHHRHRDHCQRGQVLTVRERGGLPRQRRLHRPHHQVLCLRRLLIFWILITLGCSIKYLYVFFVSDWTSLEDW